MQKIIITGCNGLVGKHLVKKCLDKGYQVIGVDISASDFDKELSNFKFYQLDLTDEKNVKDLFFYHKPDVVLNCFGIKGSPIKAKTQPVDFLYPSFKINTEIINQCYKNDVYLIFVSSVGVYSKQEEFVEHSVWETLPTENDWFPAWSKRMGELLLEAYKVQYNYTKWSIIRPANIFGEYDNFDGTGTVIASTIKKVFEAENNSSIEAWGDGTPVRDFVYAGDVADAILKLYEDKRHVIVNFGSGEEITIKGMIESLIKISGKTIDIKWDTTKPNGDMRRKMETGIQFAYELFPTIGFEMGLHKTYSHYKNKMQKIPVSIEDFKTEGVYSGKLFDFIDESESSKLNEYVKKIKEYTETDRETKLKCLYMPLGEHEPMDYYIPPSQIEARDIYMEENGLEIWQKWFGFPIHDHYMNTFFYRICLKIINTLYPHKNYTFEDFDQHGAYTLFENGHMIGKHVDSHQPKRVCAVLIYLSDSMDSNDGGGELILTSNSNKTYTVEPFLGNFAVINFENMDIEHSVNIVKNDFKRYTYINFFTEK